MYQVIFAVDKIQIESSFIEAKPVALDDSVEIGCKYKLVNAR